MCRPIVINIKKDDNYDVFIGRPSKWGNPYTHLKGKTKAEFVVETREEAIENYRGYILNDPVLMASLPDLKDKIIGCFCKPLSCHGDILADLVEEYCSEDENK